MSSKLRLISGKRIISPKLDITRPTTLMVREALFNILRQDVPNSNWLDLYSGTGSISCEAINHGAKKIFAIEKNRKNTEICFRNIFSLDKSKNREKDIAVIKEDVTSWIKSTNKTFNINFPKDFIFDFVYLDPPYQSGYYEDVLKLLAESKFINEKTTIICEHSKNVSLSINNYFKVKDQRVYGQTKLVFLIKI